MAYDPSLLAATQVESITFRMRFRGYDRDEVDAFMDRIIETLSRHESGRRTGREATTSDQVINATFKSSLRGYDLHEVDAFLDYVVVALRHFESGGRHSRDFTERSRGALFGRRATLASRVKRPKPRPSVHIEADAEQSASISETEAVKQERPRSSEELLEQAKKWLDRT